MMKKVFKATLLVITLFIAACDPETPTPPPSITGTWIDAPENNSTIGLDPYRIVFHSASPVGMDVFELRVNSNLIATVPPKMTGPGGSQGTLFMAEYEWHPPDPGVYLIEVRPKGTDDQYGPAALAEVTVLEESAAEVLAPELPTPELLATDLPMLSVPPIPTETPLVVGIGPFVYSAKKVYFRGIGCGSKELEIQVQVNDPSAYSVVLFIRLENTDSGDKSEWMSMPMNGLGNGYYGVSIVPELLFSEIHLLSSAYLDAQVVVTGQSQTEIGRTPVDSQVVVERCSS